MALRSYLTEEIVQDFADGLMTRREAMRRLGLLGLTVGGAAALLAACGGDGAPPTAERPTATTRAPASPTPGVEAVRFAGPDGELLAAWGATDSAARGGVLVIHENRGLTPHFLDVVGRLARDGYAALCVDLLSRQGGTAALSDPGQAQAALAAAPEEELLADLRAGLDELTRRVPDVRLAAVGFCFGGGMVWRLLAAGEARLAAAVPFYGPAPEQPDFSRAKAAVLAIYAEQDARVNATRPRAEAALRAAGLTYEVRVFPGVDHAFFNDTGQRYDRAAAQAAYADVLDWFGRYVAA